MALYMQSLQRGTIVDFSNITTKDLVTTLSKRLDHEYNIGVMDTRYTNLLDELHMLQRKRHYEWFQSLKMHDLLVHQEEVIASYLSIPSTNREYFLNKTASHRKQELINFVHHLLQLLEIKEYPLFASLYAELDTFCPVNSIIATQSDQFSVRWSKLYAIYLRDSLTQSEVAA